jgi:hypothetical protein
MDRLINILKLKSFFLMQIREKRKNMPVELDEFELLTLYSGSLN